MHTKTKRLVLAALLAAITCVATMLVKIPTPLKGYANLGDCIVLLSGWLLSPLYGFAAAGLGSALADLFSGYVIYAPATFVIKGLMALLASLGYRLFSKYIRPTLARIATGLACEVLMVLGYFLFEGVLYGFLPSAVNLPANAIQGAVGLILGVLLAAALGARGLLSTASK